MLFEVEQDVLGSSTTNRGDRLGKPLVPRVDVGLQVCERMDHESEDIRIPFQLLKNNSQFQLVISGAGCDFPAVAGLKATVVPSRWGDSVEYNFVAQRLQHALVYHGDDF